jgi:NAD(P)-dependent dehydrogenase (short-subunit alcohol dehydrogenase family)
VLQTRPGVPAIKSKKYGLLPGLPVASDLMLWIARRPDEEVRKNYNANVFGLLHATCAILPYLRQQHSGHIIAISSIDGLSGYVDWDWDWGYR